MSTQTPKLTFDENCTLLVAHRGLTSKHLENTLEALQAAFEAGADGVEFDVQLSCDMVPMVFHDRTLERLTGFGQNIDDVSFSKLKNLEQSNGRYATTYLIPTLAEVLHGMPANKLINIELKETTGMKGEAGMMNILRTIAPYKNKLKIVISSFEPEILALVHKLDPSYALGFLLDQRQTLEAFIKGDMIFNKIDYLHPHINLIDKNTSRLLRDKGVNLILWGHKRMGEEKKFIDDHHTALISDVTQELVESR